jgi:hypothetical protein
MISGSMYLGTSSDINALVARVFSEGFRRTEFPAAIALACKQNSTQLEEEGENYTHGGVKREP